MVLGFGMWPRNPPKGAVGHAGKQYTRPRFRQPAARRHHAYARLARHPRVGVGRIGSRLLMAHMNELDFVRAQLGKDREKMPAIDRKTIARAVFPHYARNKFAAAGFAHQKILLKVTPPSSCPWPWTCNLGRNGVTSSDRINVN